MPKMGRAPERRDLRSYLFLVTMSKLALSVPPGGTSNSLSLIVFHSGRNRVALDRGRCAVRAAGGRIELHYGPARGDFDEVLSCHRRRSSSRRS